jgi:hypothetical protein
VGYRLTEIAGKRFTTRLATMAGVFAQAVQGMAGRREPGACKRPMQWATVVTK